MGYYGRYLASASILGLKVNKISWKQTGPSGATSARRHAGRAATGGGNERNWNDFESRKLNWKTFLMFLFFRKCIGVLSFHTYSTHVPTYLPTSQPTSSLLGHILPLLEWLSHVQKVVLCSLDSYADISSAVVHMNFGVYLHITAGYYHMCRVGCTIEGFLTHALWCKG